MKKKISINLNKLENRQKNIWSSFIKSKEKIKKNDKIIFFKAFHAIVDSLKDYENQITYHLKFNISFLKLTKIMKTYGRMPIPPYIQKRGFLDSDFNDYQTIFAEKEGCCCFSNSKFAFTNKLIESLKKKNKNNKNYFAR